MRTLGSLFGINGRFFGSMLLCAGAALGQNPPASHVTIPNPTPRPPDLKQQLGDDSKDRKKQQTTSIESQLRAREIWLDSNRILLLAQQLEQEMLSGTKSSSMAADAAKVGQIEKLAQSVQEKMKTR